MNAKPEQSARARFRTGSSTQGEDAFEDWGDPDRALLKLGRDDVNLMGIGARDIGFRVPGGSSGYSVVDVTGAEHAVRAGDEVTFALDHGALVEAMTLESVKKRLSRGGGS